MPVPIDSEIQLLHRLRLGGGAIVSSNVCHGTEITQAKIDCRYYEDQWGNGYVLRSQEWLRNVTDLSAERAGLLPRGSDGPVVPGKFF